MTAPETIRVVVILPAIDSTGGGVSEAARLLTSAWAEREDAMVEVVTLDGPGLEEARASWPDVLIRAFPYSGVKRLGASRAMERFLAQQDYDVAHVHGLWMFHCRAALRWSLRFGRPILVSPHGMLAPWILNRSRAVKTALSLIFQRRFLKHTALFHALTQREASEIRAVAPGASIAVVPNFVIPHERRARKPSWWHHRMSERRVFMFFGRIHEKKGWRELLLAWERICHVQPSFAKAHELVFCGWIDNAPDFQNEIARLYDLHGNVTFAGPQYGDDKHNSFAAADVFILPSKSEGLPMSVLEAWAAGCPVAMTEACNLPLGFEERAALKIGCDTEALIYALETIASMSDDELDALAAKGRLLQERMYSSEACATKLWNALTSTIEAARG